MEIKWTVEENEEENVLLKTFLKKRQISKRVLTKVKYRGGKSQSKRTPCESP